MAPGVLDGAFLGLSHPVFDLGEGLLDGVEVGRILGQEEQPGAGRFDGVADGLGFVAAEIVHDDDVAGSEGRHQLLVDVGAEALAVDRAVEDAGSGQAITAKCPEEGQGTPAAVRREAAQPPTFRAPAAQGRHVGADPGLVDEDEAFGVEPALPGLPASTPAGNVRPTLLKSEQRFF